jgi:site-specific DNA-methyltransferase (adenine-specific)
MFFPLYSFVYPVHPTTVWSIIYTTISRDIFLAAALLFLITSLLKSSYAASPGDPSPGSKHSDAAFTPSQTEQHATTAPRSQRSPVMAKQTPPYFPHPTINTMAPRTSLSPAQAKAVTAALGETKNLLVGADNASVLAALPDAFFQLIYIDPPFNTGRTQKRSATTSTRDPKGARTGFGGQNYTTVIERLGSYDDRFSDYWGSLGPKLEEAWRLLTPTGTLYLHLDYREAHYAKVALDALFGRDSFLNEIIWAYDYGAKSKSKWPAKHDTILVYVKDPLNYYFDSAEVDREPYMAPGLVTPEKAAKGKLPTDTWFHTIVPTSGKEKTGYPTQKPEGILRRIITASSAPGDYVLDFFSGSGTTAAVAAKLGRHYVAVDENPEALAIMKKRLKPLSPTKFIGPIKPL